MEINLIWFGKVRFALVWHKRLLKLLGKLWPDSELYERADATLVIIIQLICVPNVNKSFESHLAVGLWKATVTEIGIDDSVVKWIENRYLRWIDGKLLDFTSFYRLSSSGMSASVSFQMFLLHCHYPFSRLTDTSTYLNFSTLNLLINFNVKCWLWRKTIIGSLIISWYYGKV